MCPSPILNIDSLSLSHLDDEWVTNAFLSNLTLQSAEQQFLLSPCTKSTLQSQDNQNVKNVHFFGP